MCALRFFPRTQGCTPLARLATTNRRWPRATWKASWRPSSPTATPTSQAGGAYLHRGAEGLRELYTHMFANGGGIPLAHCTLTDDSVLCAIEYNCVRWGVTDIPPRQAWRCTSEGAAGC